MDEARNANAGFGAPSIYGAPEQPELRAKMDAARREGLLRLAETSRPAREELVSQIRARKERHIGQLSALHEIEMFLLTLRFNEIEAIQKYSDLCARIDGD